MKIGTIGTGPIVEVFLDAVRQVDGVACTAVYSRQEAKARALADAFGVHQTYTQLSDLMDDDNIDCIYIASPNSLHFEQAWLALEKGKHVILEKPFASTAEEAAHLIRLAEKNNRFLFEAITTLHLPNYLKARELLAQLGTIRLVQCSYVQYSARYDKLLAGEITNVFDPAFSGGCLYDLNIYNLHFVQGLFGPPKSVLYRPNLARNGIDTSGIALMMYDGFVASCAGAKDSVGPSFSLIHGSKGYIRFTSPAHMCLGFEFAVGDTMTWIDLQNSPHHDTRLKAGPYQKENNRMVHEIRAFADCFDRRDFKTARAWLDHSLNVMKTVESARKDAGIVFAADAHSIV